ncbi:MAG: hypothetical protein ACE5MK_09535 [Acidobacteriota bacterium]
MDGIVTFLIVLSVGLGVLVVGTTIARRRCDRCNNLGLRKSGRSRIHEDVEEIEFQCSYCGFREWKDRAPMVPIYEKEGKGWKELSHRIGAEFIKKDSKVRLRFREWIITLYSTEETDYRAEGLIPVTYMRAPYGTKDGFAFEIYPWAISLGKLFGERRVRVGVPEIDSNFIIQSTNEAKVRALFANPRIRQLIQIHGKFNAFGVRWAEGLNELYLRSEGTISDVERLKSLFELFTETLSQLVAIGSASEEAPNVEV